MFLAIDTFILEKIVTPPVHAFERRTGLTKYFLVWWAYGLAALGFMMSYYVLYREDSSYFIKHPFLAVLFVGILFFIALLMHGAQKKNDAAMKNPHMLPEPERPGESVWRLTFVFFVLFDLLNLAEKFSATDLSWTFGFFCYVAAMYLRAVKRPPPRFKKEPESKLSPLPATH